jgi:His/Glu/Gln/Arg/opine family amino acid ABC transporter permease subunit
MSYPDVVSMLYGALTTLLLSLAGIVLGFPLGLAMALICWRRIPFAAKLVAACASFLRASPLVTIVLLLFYGLPDVAGIDMSPVAAGVLALTLNTSAFNCEVWRAALAEVPREQIEAALSVGMRSSLLLRRIVLPQAIHASMPGLVNEMTQLVKATPVLSVVGVVDITRAAVRIGADTYEPMPPLLVAIAIYVPMVFVLVVAQRWIERRHARSEEQR